MLKPWVMGSLENQRDSNGRFTGMKEAYGDQFIVVHTPTQLKAAYTSIVLYSATARVARQRYLSMAHISKHNIEDMLSMLKEKHGNLLEALNGEELSETEVIRYELHQPHVFIKSRKFRVAIAEMEIVLKEAKRLLDRDSSPSCMRCRCSENAG